MNPTSETNESDASGAPDCLTTPVEFEVERGYRVSRRMLRASLALTTVALVWAAAAPIRELSVAHGQLIPTSQVRSVQHLEGGIVDRILVAEGQTVEKDQPLMSLQAVTAQSDLAALKTRARHLLLQKETDEALIERRAPNLFAIQDVTPALVAEYEQVYQLRFDHRAKERELLLTRIDQRKAVISGLKIEIATHTRLAEIQKEQLDARQELALIGDMSKKQLSDTETAYEQARVMMQGSTGKLAEEEEGLKEAVAALAEADAQAQKLWSEELAKTSSELIEVQEQIKSYSDRVERLTVRAPTRGWVQQISQRSSGEVVRPGDTIAQIVPLGDALIAEVLVKPEDIAAVKLHAKAELKVTAYDFARYGKISGQVTEISPTTVQQDDKRSYYKVHIGFDPHQLDRFASVWRLQPGMTVDADIVSGSKSLLQYLLRPIYRGVDAAFSER